MRGQTYKKVAIKNVMVDHAPGPISSRLRCGEGEPGTGENRPRSTARAALAQPNVIPCVCATGFGVGETVFQICIVSASRRLQADRFFTDSCNEDVYTPEGLRWIDRTDFKAVILRHYPELADSSLANIKNAFEPWNEGPQLDPAQHPLRQWDSDLKPDPWRGDAYRQA